MPKFIVQTDNPVAWYSRDHTQPGGTQHDNSRWHPFNDKLYTLMARRPLRIMDLGCAGGGFIKDCIDDGHLAVGLEGSDFSLIRKRAEWATIPENLFTADVTEPFTVLEDGVPARFDCVTAWEMMEHIEAHRLPGLCRNVRNHLKEDGIWVMSVSMQTNDSPESGHHMTIEGPEWWLSLMGREGFVNYPGKTAYFGTDMVRGPWAHGNAPKSFHLVLMKK